MAPYAMAGLMARRKTSRRSPGKEPVSRATPARVLGMMFPLVMFASGCVQQQDPPLFSRADVLAVRLEAPFGRLVENGRWDTTYSVRGRLTYLDPAGRSTALNDVDIEIRGNSSRDQQECAFPKLTLHFRSDDALERSIFRDQPKIDIGTHCDDRSDGTLTAVGRLGNELSPPREAWVYRVVSAVGVETFKVRTARITYIDVEQEGGTASSATAVERNAIFVEDSDSAKARLRATEVDHFANAAHDFASDDTIRLLFAEAMIGNFDWCLKYSVESTYQCTAKERLYNLIALKRADGPAFPLMYDFDLAGAVTGGNRWLSKVYSDEFAPRESRRRVEVTGQVERSRSLFSRSQIDAARKRFVERKDLAYETFAASRLDAIGNEIGREYLDAFFQLMADDNAFYTPVVTAAGTNAWTRPMPGEPACPTDNDIPVGTPVGDSVARAGAMIQAPLLDVLWKWYDRCPATRKPVWLPSSAVSDAFPRLGELQDRRVGKAHSAAGACYFRTAGTARSPHSTEAVTNWLPLVRRCHTR